MQWAKLPLSQLIESSRNIRSRFEGIEGLADTIAEHGLLQNLVVEPCSLIRDQFEVCSGARRLRAMRLLVERGTWEKSHEVPVLIKGIDDDNSFAWVNTLENLQREDVPIWEYGRRFTELIDAGYTQPEIAARIGRNQGYVSRAIHIATAIEPKVLEAIAALKGRRLTASQLTQMAHLIDKKTLEPDPTAQHRYLAMCLSSPPRKKRGTKADGKPAVVYRRFQKLKGGSSFSIPFEYMAAVRAVVRYLEGTTRTIRIDPDDIG